jgi:hypothetical protein
MEEEEEGKEEEEEEEEEESLHLDPLDPRHETEMKQPCVDGEDAVSSKHPGNRSLGGRIAKSAWEAVWQNTTSSSFPPPCPSFLPNQFVSLFMRIF